MICDKAWKLSFIFTILIVFSSRAQDVLNLEKLPLEELLDVRLIRIATGTQKTLAKAPAIASVITAEDIEQMGVRYLHEVLNTVPGLYVGRSVFYDNPLFIIRGMSTSTTPQVLFLVNGKRYITAYLNTLGRIPGKIPVKMISRIEIIRGPGSALYGADAFSGVINIITKDKDDIEGSEFGATGGSFDSYQAWALHGERYGKVNTVFGLQYSTTQGHREIVDQDLQTARDNNTGTNVSHAPGPMNNMTSSVDSHLDLVYKRWNFEVRNRYIFDHGTGVGSAGALDPNGRWKESQTDIALEYDNPDLVENWELQSELDYMVADTYVDKGLFLFPPGSTTSTGSTFPEGVIGKPSRKEDRISLSTSALYKGLIAHRIRLGVEFNHTRLFDITEVKNFNAQNERLPGGLQDVTGTSEVYLPDINRTNYAIFAQDEWSLSNTLELTVGARFDQYSDFGETINPRVAFVWSGIPKLTGKLLYGRAFRAPAISELHIRNNPVFLGNPDLNPEKVDSFELALDYHPIKALALRTNFYHYRVDDQIGFLQTTNALKVSNIGGVIGNGLEFELDYKPIKDLKIAANYSFQNSRLKETKEHMGRAPRSVAHLRSHWTFLPDYELNTRINWVDTFKREKLDPREELEGYTTVDLAFHKLKILPETDLILSLLNIFDEKYRHPSPGPSPLSPTISIPNDFPEAGRSFFIGLSTNL